MNTHQPPINIYYLHWQSRRSLLELDLLLAAFWRKHGDTLSRAETNLLGEWLFLDDTQLWQLLKNPPADGKSLAEKIHPCGAVN